MRVWNTVIASLLSMTLLFKVAPQAAAQPYVPDRGMGAIGGDVGFFFPSEIFDTGPTLAGFLEYYLSRRASLRTTFGWSDPEFEFGDEDSLRQLRLVFNVFYNWEYGKWHPLVGAGIGPYFLQLKHDGRSVGDSETQLGVNLGGGVEYFVTRVLTIKGEALYHFIGEGDLPWDPSGLTLAIGLKRYF
jgi:opacity protein-like surface antigen